MNTDLSLLPNQAKFRAARIRLREKINLFAWFFSIVWVILVLIVFMGWFLVRLQLANINRNYQKIDAQYKTMFGDLVISRQIKLNAKLVGKILTDRFEYGRSLINISNLFASSPKVFLGDYSLQESKRFILKGVVTGSNGIDEIEKKIDDINNGSLEGFVGASLTNLSFLNNLWQFEMEVTVK